MPLPSIETSTNGPVDARTFCALMLAAISRRSIRPASSVEDATQLRGIPGSRDVPCESLLPIAVTFSPQLSSVNQSSATPSCWAQGAAARSASSASPTGALAALAGLHSVSSGLR